MIGDLGISIKSSMQAIIGGTPCYMAPELVESCLKKSIVDVSSFGSDMWALGCVMYELATLKKAYYAKSKDLVFRLIKDESPPEIISSYILNSLLNMLLRKEPQKRPESIQFRNSISVNKL